MMGGIDIDVFTKATNTFCHQMIKTLTMVDELEGPGSTRVSLNIEKTIIIKQGFIFTNKGIISLCKCSVCNLVFCIDLSLYSFNVPHLYLRDI